MLDARSYLFLAGPSPAAPGARGRRIGRLGLAALLGLAACGDMKPEEAKEAAKEAGQEVAQATREVAQATREAASRGAEQAAEQLDKVDPEKIERTIDGVAGAMGVQTEADPAHPGADPLADAAQAIACDEARLRCTVTADFADRARTHGHRVAQQLRVTPAPGGVTGVRIDAIDAGTLAALVGLKVGDVITHVNGTPIGSAQDAVMLYMDVRRAESFVIDYQRSGEARTLKIDVV